MRHHRRRKIYVRNVAVQVSDDDFPVLVLSGLKHKVPDVRNENNDIAQFEERSSLFQTDQTTKDGALSGDLSLLKHDFVRKHPRRLSKEISKSTQKKNKVVF